MAADESRQLAQIAAVTDDLDRLLDDLFASVEQLKAVLAPPGRGDAAGNDPASASGDDGGQADP